MADQIMESLTETENVSPSPDIHENHMECENIPPMNQNIIINSKETNHETFITNSNTLNSQQAKHESHAAGDDGGFDVNGSKSNLIGNLDLEAIVGK